MDFEVDGRADDGGRRESRDDEGGDYVRRNAGASPLAGSGGARVRRIALCSAAAAAGTASSGRRYGGVKHTGAS